MLAKTSPRTQERNDGFSLLEIVIAVGLLMILSAVGTVAVRGFDDRAKEAAVQRAAREVYNVARAKAEDGRANTKPEDAATEYNNSQTKKTANNNRPITTKVIQNSSNPNDLRVEAYYDGGRINAVYDPSGSAGTTEGSGSGSGGAVLPVIRDTISQLTYNCDATTQGYLPVYNISDSTTVSMVGSDGSEKLVDYAAPASNIDSAYGSIQFSNYSSNQTFNNVSEKLTMKAKVNYTIKVYGTFENLSNVRENMNVSSFNDCLISVDKWGEQSGIRAVNSIGGKKFVSVPDNLPPTIFNLVTAFKDTSAFNSLNVSKWDTSNVNQFSYMFYNATAFNSPIDSWDVGKISDFRYLFYSARSFNQPLNSWDTSRVTNMYSMFNVATEFNQPLDNWNTSKTRSMKTAFANTRDFNGNISTWDTSSVTDMEGMFHNATSFKGPIAKTTTAWDTSNVITMKNMFRGTRAIYTDISKWDTSKVTDMSGMFMDSVFYHNIVNWNVSSVTTWTDFATNSRLLNSYPERVPAKFR